MKQTRARDCVRVRARARARVCVRALACMLKVDAPRRFLTGMHQTMMLPDGTQLMRHDRYDTLHLTHGLSHDALRARGILRIDPRFRVVALVCWVTRGGVQRLGGIEGLTCATFNVHDFYASEMLTFICSPLGSVHCCERDSGELGGYVIDIARRTPTKVRQGACTC